MNKNTVLPNGNKYDPSRDLAEQLKELTQKG
jgi:hypothetical protein